MASDIKISVPDDLRQAVEAAARTDGKTIDEIGVEALRRHLARRALERLKQQGEGRRKGKSDEEIAAMIERAIGDVRAR